MPITMKDIHDGRDPLLEALAKPDRQRSMKGYAPHYSLGEALMQEQALAGVMPNHNQRGTAPVKQARQSQYPDRARRIEYANALEARQAAEKAEREKAGM